MPQLLLAARNKSVLEWETQKVTCLRPHFQKEKATQDLESLGRNLSVGPAEAESFLGVTLYRSSHSGVGTKASLRSSRCALRSASAQFHSPVSQVKDSIKAKPGSGDDKGGYVPVGSASLALGHSRKSARGCPRRVQGGTVAATAEKAAGAVAPGRQPQGNTCRGRMRRTRRRTHLRARGAQPGADPGVPGPLCPGSPSRPGARWGKGPRAATALTWQHLLLPRRQQQSRQPLAPSSAAASSSAAATSRPSGTANRHNRRRPRCRSRPRTPGGREGSGRRGDAVRPLGSGSGAGGQGAAASQSRGAGATRGPQGSAEGSAGPRTRPRLGLLLSTPSLPPRSMPGNGGRGEGCTRWPGRCGEARAGPEVGRQPGRGATPPTVAVGRPGKSYSGVVLTPVEAVCTMPCLWCHFGWTPDKNELEEVACSRMQGADGETET
ncbi:uncharacterized protein [Callorhinus ursinus]|uniref:uncharacterized protein n=1 Tax=Callorhinus ursinus TaxID=34884 RepID=UPI003CD01A21